MTDIRDLISASSLGGPIPAALKLADSWDRAAVGESHARSETFKACASELRKMLLALPEVNDFVTEQTYSVTEVAETFSVTPYTVRQWLKDGVIRGGKPNGQWRITESALRQFSIDRFSLGDSS